MKKILPFGKSVIVLLCFLLVFAGALIAFGIWLIVYGFQNEPAAIVAGCFFIVFPIILVYALIVKIRYDLRVEFLADSVIIYRIEIWGRGLLKHYSESIFYEGLIGILFDKKNGTFLFEDKTEKKLKFNDFSKKQIIRIKLEIMNQACQVNGKALLDFSNTDSTRAIS